MNDLVFLEPNKIDSEPYTTSDTIATHANINYRSVQRTIERYESDLSEFGQVRFEITPVVYARGRNDKKTYKLNEEQATLLITYLKNTPQVRQFKKNLVQQFFIMRRELLQRRVNRSQLKPIRREMTDVIQLVDESRWAYKKYTDLAYKMATGKIASKLREERGAKKSAVAIDYMTADEISAVTKLQYQIAVLLEMGMDYQQIKSALANRLLLTSAS